VIELYPNLNGFACPGIYAEFAELFSYRHYAWPDCLSKEQEVRQTLPKPDRAWYDAGRAGGLNGGRLTQEMYHSHGNMKDAPWLEIDDMPRFMQKVDEALTPSRRQLQVEL